MRQADGDLAPTVWLPGAAQALRKITGAVRPADDEAAHAILVETLREALGEPASPAPGAPAAPHPTRRSSRRSP